MYCCVYRLCNVVDKFCQTAFFYSSCCQNLLCILGNAAVIIQSWIAVYGTGGFLAAGQKAGYTRYTMITFSGCVQYAQSLHLVTRTERKKNFSAVNNNAITLHVMEMNKSRYICMQPGWQSYCSSLHRYSLEINVATHGQEVWYI